MTGINESDNEAEPEPGHIEATRISENSLPLSRPGGSINEL